MELTRTQKVPCTFELTVPGLGYLEGNMSGEVSMLSKYICTSVVLTVSADEARVKGRAAALARRDAGTQVKLFLYG